ncbi:hypothetical protein J2W56_001952 [Nocardia kruczakiae]|uniref:Uncharacterized protein n=1 Tax=Nocardia kruczakiae TaxID=261477 RepID=A0ABU1XDS4_9NOCA|nr:hypothetical protein [Nocardia kruczakiae]
MCSTPQFVPRRLTETAVTAASGAVSATALRGGARGDR